jgi:hypothetical protein
LWRLVESEDIVSEFLPNSVLVEPLGDFGREFWGRAQARRDMAADGNHIAPLADEAEALHVCLDLAAAAAEDEEEPDSDNDQGGSGNVWDVCDDEIPEVLSEVTISVHWSCSYNP